MMRPSALLLLFWLTFFSSPLIAQEHTYVCPMECERLVFEEAGSCPVCGMDLVSENGTETTALMPGISDSFFNWGWLALLLATALGWRLGSVTDVPNRRTPRRRWVWSPSWLTRAASSRLVPFLIQIPVIFLFVLVIAAGLFGSQEPGQNIAPILTWNIWWMGLIFFAFFIGQGWCTVCPWMAIPDWALNLAGRFRKETGGGVRWPRQLRNLYPAIVMFFVVTWLELVYAAPYRPALTAWMGVGLVVAAGTMLVVFERKTFCRYVCAIGRATGAYGMTGMAAIRRVDQTVCKTCVTKDCFHGNEHGLACPTYEFMGAMNDNMNCTMCTECLKTCPESNIEVQIRAPFSDVFGSHRHRTDEAMFVLLLAFVSVFHGIAMVPFWNASVIEPIVARLGGVTEGGYLMVVTGAMLGFIVLQLMVYAGFIGLLRLFNRSVGFRFRRYFVAFAYASLPVSLAYHLAHNSLHFSYEGTKLVRVASDPFGFGWDLFGTANAATVMLVPMSVLYAIQLLILCVGYGVSVGVVGQIARRIVGNRRQVVPVRLVVTLFFALYAAGCLWLLYQPMEMRTG